MQLIPVDSIQISPNRQRKQFNQDKHIELCESLQYSAVGLQNAIVVRKEGEQVFLVSGERRLRAVKDVYELNGKIKYASQPIEQGLIPAVDVGELSPLARAEAEWEENYLRDDLTWQERVAATQALLELRTGQRAAVGEAPPTYKELVEEISPEKVSEGSAIGIVSRDLKLAKHLDDPAIKTAKSAKEAMKILKVKERREKHEQLAAIVGTTYSASLHSLFNEDSIDWMDKCEDEKFDVILTDPPYGMGADEFGDSGVLTVGEHQYEDSEDNWRSLMLAFSALSFYKAAKDAHLYCFCDFDKFHQSKVMFENAGWKVFRTPLIWSKPSAYRAPWPDKGPRRTYECILFAVKGDKKVNTLQADVLTYNSDENLGHHAQKPVALYKDLLSRSIQPGQRVLDPFCGSGPIFPAAKELQCYATGIEIDTVHYGIAAERLKKLIG